MLGTIFKVEICKLRNLIAKELKTRLLISTVHDKPQERRYQPPLDGDRGLKIYSQQLAVAGLNCRYHDDVTAPNIAQKT